MTRRPIGYAMVLAWLMFSLTATDVAQRRDPLNPKEVDQMRDAADWPNKRLELMVEFARQRLAAIEQLEANTKNSKDRPMQIHDLLQDFSALLDEIGDNVDMYSKHNADMRQGLAVLLEASSEWALQLKRLKAQAPPEELQQYSFALASALDDVNDTADDTREELQEQNTLAKQNKLVKVYSERPK
ncbi:MAG TPA: hypothetical protein VKV05_07795 [Terriglobales bacterium]|nr:hypothetical protein [Terriglobales bacterium]